MTCKKAGIPVGSKSLNEQYAKRGWNNKAKYEKDIARYRKKNNFNRSSISYATFAGGFLGMAQRDDMYMQNQKLKERLKMLEINSIQDPQERQAALDKHKQNQSKFSTKLSNRFKRVLSTM